MTMGVQISYTLHLFFILSLCSYCVNTIKNLELRLLVVLIKCKTTYEHAKISVSKIGILMLKTASISLIQATIFIDYDRQITVGSFVCSKDLWFLKSRLLLHLYFSSCAIKKPKKLCCNQLSGIIYFRNTDKGNRANR